MGTTVGKVMGPTRLTNIPEDPKERKTYPISSGFLEYFPDAVAEVAHISWAGNEQHHPGEELHWDRSKSTDEADALMRHFMARGTRDTDGKRHSAKAAWRMMAILQKEIEAERSGGAATQWYDVNELDAVDRWFHKR